MILSVMTLALLYTVVFWHYTITCCLLQADIVKKSLYDKLEITNWPYINVLLTGTTLYIYLLALHYGTRKMNLYMQEL